MIRFLWAKLFENSFSSWPVNGSETSKMCKINSAWAMVSRLDESLLLVLSARLGRPAVSQTAPATRECSPVSSIVSRVVPAIGETMAERAIYQSARFSTAALTYTQAEAGCWI